MIRNTLPLCFVVGMLVALQGCRTVEEPVVEEAPVVAEVEEVAEPAEPVRQTVRVGRIVDVDENGRFAIVQLNPGVEVSPGVELSARSGGVEVARLRVTPEGDAGMIAPTVIMGKPQVGNEVTQVVERAPGFAPSGSVPGAELDPAPAEGAPGTVPRDIPAGGIIVE